MRGLVELLSIPSMLIILGAPLWACLDVLASSDDVGDGSGDLFTTYRALSIASTGFVVMLIAGCLKQVPRKEPEA